MKHTKEIHGPRKIEEKYRLTFYKEFYKNQEDLETVVWKGLLNFLGLVIRIDRNRLNKSTLTCSGT